MRYLYRCAECGYEQTLGWPMKSPVPETFPLQLGEHTTWTGEHVMPGPLAKNASIIICQEPLKRVYEPPMANLGYREGIHTQNERHLFQYVK